MRFQNSIYSHEHQAKSIFAYLHSSEYDQGLDHYPNEDEEETSEAKDDSGPETDAFPREMEYDDDDNQDDEATSEDDRRVSLEEFQVRVVSRAWVDVYATVMHIINRLETPNETLASPYLGLSMDELCIIGNNIEPLLNAINAIDLKILDSYDYEVIHFQEDLLVMLPVLRDFAGDIYRVIDWHRFDPYKLCSGYREIFEWYRSRLDKTHRTASNLRLNDLLNRPSHGELETYKNLLKLFLEIWATFRNFFYGFRLIINSTMYSGGRPPPGSP